MQNRRKRLRQPIHQLLPNEGRVLSCIKNILNFVEGNGLADDLRPGLVDTPMRMLKSWRELLSGYGKLGNDLSSYTMTSFPNDKNYSEIVLVKDIEFYSMCEHHFLPFFGVCHIGYIPDKRIVGLSKIPRTVDIFARRLQLQERLTVQIAECLMRSLKPLGVGVIVEATHLCMCSRGAKKKSVTMTSCLDGCFCNQATRGEFTSLVFGRR